MPQIMASERNACPFGNGREPIGEGSVAHTLAVPEDIWRKLCAEVCRPAEQNSKSPLDGAARLLVIAAVYRGQALAGRLAAHGRRYAALGAVYLGDDLLSCQPLLPERQLLRSRNNTP